GNLEAIDETSSCGIVGDGAGPLWVTAMGAESNGGGAGAPHGSALRGHHTDGRPACEDRLDPETLSRADALVHAWEPTGLGDAGAHPWLVPARDRRFPGRADSRPAARVRQERRGDTPAARRRTLSERRLVRSVGG